MHVCLCSRRGCLCQVAEDVGRYGELEKEKNQLEVELQTAHNWMAMYEDKYDLTKAVAYSKVPSQYTHPRLTGRYMDVVLP